MVHAYQKAAEAYHSHIIGDLKRLVACESPSDSADALDQAVDLLVEVTGNLAKPKTFRASGYGRHLRLDFHVAAPRQSARILALGHLDTVWPLGTLSSMPWREADGRLWGPGVLDMKAGLVFFLYAVRILRDLDIALRRRVSLLVVSDEEVGSPTSRALTETEAQLSSHVLVLEPGTGLEGKLKTARKSVGRYAVAIRGLSAHAGVDFEKGASAIVEAAHVVQACAALTDVGRGITVNPGLVRGGTRSNVIAEHANLEVDVRAERMIDAMRIDKKIRALRSADLRCEIKVEGGVNRPPMERRGPVAKLYKEAKQIGAAMGIVLEESATGGGSDGNFTAALGIPTLDGLGAVGEGAHAANESILIDKICERTALLAGLIAGLP